MNCFSYKIASSLLLLATLCALLTGCLRDELCYLHTDEALIELQLDWSRSRLTPSSATAYIYQDDRYFRAEIFSAYPPLNKRISLPVGNYKILVFNEQPEDYAGNLSFLNVPHWNEVQASAFIDSASVKALPSEQLNYIVSGLDTLAAARSVELLVTEEMVRYSHTHPVSKEEAESHKVSKTITFAPKRVFTVCNLTLNILNGEGYYFTSRRPALLSGASLGYFLGRDRYNSALINHRIDFKQLQLPATKGNGDLTMRANLQIVGFPNFYNPESSEGVEDYSVSLPFTYYGGIIVKDLNLLREATRWEYLPEDPTIPGRHYNQFNVVIDMELPKIEYIGGFEVGVEDWGEVDIPLDTPHRLHFVANNGSKETFWWSNLPGVIVHLPAPLFSPVNGLEFVAWNSMADGSGLSFQPGDSFEMQRRGIDFYAIWRKIAE